MPDEFRDRYFNDLQAMEGLLREKLEEAPIAFQRIRVSCRPEATHIQVDCATVEQFRMWQAHLCMVRGLQKGSMAATTWRDGFSILLMVGSQ